MSIAARRQRRGIHHTTSVTPTVLSLWSASDHPTAPPSNDSQPIELGLRFRVEIAAELTGLRFYKAAADTATTHSGTLWNSAGTALGSLTFSGETASGWQTASFAAPIALAAGVTYTVSYHSTTGTYVGDAGYFTARRQNSVLIGLSSAEASGNGVFAYGASQYPTQSYGATNYWVDPIIAAVIIPDTTPPSAPQNLVATPSGSYISLTWQASTDNRGVAGYEYAVDGGNYTATGSITPACVISGLTPSTSYNIAVRAYDSAGNRSPAATVICSTTTGTSGPPSVFQDFTAASWGAAASAKTSGDGVWRINGDWVGTGGNTLLASNGTIDFTAPGILTLTCQANSTNAAEIQSVSSFAHGYFECRMKVGKVAGTCQSFFLIGEGYGPGEIDFEFLTGGTLGGWLNTTTGAVMVNVHPTNNAVEVTLPFNPCDAFHTYGILWTPTKIDFVVDGTVRHTWTNLPAEVGPGAEPMYVMANNWTASSPNWGGGPPAADVHAQYDYFKVWPGASEIPT